MPSPLPDSDIGTPLLRQAWRHVTFINWRCSAGDIAPHLPPGLTVDEYNGTAWVSITPLQMADVRPRGLPALPKLSAFPETNVRTYVRDEQGRGGLWFFSLEADSRWITILAPLLLGTPYRNGELSIDVDADTVHYRGVRDGGGAAYDVLVRPGQPLRQPTDLDVWLTSRWRAFSQHAGLLLEIPVRHEPWHLREATCEALDESLTSAAGVPAPMDDVHVRYSDGVADVEFGAIRPTGSAQRR